MRMELFALKALCLSFLEDRGRGEGGERERGEGGRNFWDGQSFEFDPFAKLG